MGLQRQRSTQRHMAFRCYFYSLCGAGFIFHGNLNHMFLFYLHQIHSKVVSLQPFEVIRAPYMDSANVYFCDFFLKLALKMSMLHFLKQVNLKWKRLKSMCLRLKDFSTLQMWMSFCHLVSSFSFFPVFTNTGFLGIYVKTMLRADFSFWEDSGLSFPFYRILSYRKRNVSTFSKQFLELIWNTQWRWLSMSL